MSNQEIMQKIEAVNKLLLEGEPENISVDDHGGTTYTGYKPQYLIDAMNQVFDIGAWGFEEVSSEITPGEKGLAIAQVKVWIEGVKAQPVGWGQNRVTRGDIGDARKGAQTDAIKKALSYFSIGNRAYRGLLPNPKQQQPARPAQNAPRPMPAQQVPAKSQQNGVSKPVATQQENKPLSVEDRVKEAYKRALALRQFSFKANATDKEKTQAFLDFVGSLVNAQLTSVKQITGTRIDTVETFLNAKDAA